MPAFYPQIPLAELRAADLDQIMAINVRGALLAIQACLPPMTEHGYGRIVLTSSITGAVVGQPGYAHYGATKAAMVGLMRSAAPEVAAAGITINAVVPGNISTSGFADLGPEHARSMLAAIPLGRFGDPLDVGWAVRFLA
jgi:3-oxoacyl-[acyl-carrier protein] reductase